MGNRFGLRDEFDLLMARVSKYSLGNGGIAEPYPRSVAWCFIALMWMFMLDADV